MRRDKIIRPRFPSGVMVAAAAATSDSAAYTNYAGRVSLDSTHVPLVQGLLNGLTTDGVFLADGTSLILDALYITAAQDLTTAKKNLVQDTFHLTYNGTPAEADQFVVNQGYTGDGTTVYLDTGFLPSSSGHNYVQDSASVGVYVTSSRQTGGNKVLIGATQNATVYINACQFAENSHCIVHGGTVIGTILGTNGLWIATRRAASGTDAVEAYNWSTVNGGTGSVGTSTSASDVVPYSNIFLLALDDASTPAANLDDATIAAAFIGSGLTTAVATAIARRLYDYMNGLPVSLKMYDRP